MFALCAAYRLKIAQPALDHDGHFTYAALLQPPRYVNFIEMICLVFRRDALGVPAPLYSLGFESGIDLIRCNLTCEGPHVFAVLDACPLTHTEPVGTRKADNGFTKGKRYEDDITALLAQFNLPWLSCVA